MSTLFFSCAQHKMLLQSFTFSCIFLYWCFFLWWNTSINKVKCFWADSIISNHCSGWPNAIIPWENDHENQRSMLDEVFSPLATTKKVLYEHLPADLWQNYWHWNQCLMALLKVTHFWCSLLYRLAITHTHQQVRWVWVQSGTFYHHPPVHLSQSEPQTYLSWWSIPVSISHSGHSDEGFYRATQSWEQDGLEMRHIRARRKTESHRERVWREDGRVMWNNVLETMDDDSLVWQEAHCFKLSKAIANILTYASHSCLQVKQYSVNPKKFHM